MRSERRQKYLQGVLRGPSLVLHVVSYGLAVSASVLAMTAQGLSAPWVVAIVSGPFVLLFGLLAGPWVRRLWQIEPHAKMFVARPARGVVAFVSPGRGSETARRAVEFHGASLERAWLVHSEASREAAEEIVRELSTTEHLRRGVFELVALSDPEFGNPGVVSELVNREVFEALPDGLSPEDVIVDVTGGLKGTTAGAFLAGLPRGRRLQYVQPAVRDDRGRGEAPGDPLEIEIDYKLKRLRSR